MTNFEMYREDILRINADGNVAVSKAGNKPVPCKELLCNVCKFNTKKSGCTQPNEIINWLYEEYQKPALRLTKAERGFCEIVQGGYIARSESGYIEFYFSRPVKFGSMWLTYDNNRSLPLDKNSFSFIQWDDDKPWSVEDLLKLGIEE